jgi:hypothetical protein
MAEQQPLWKVMRNAYDRSSVPTEIIEASDSQAGDCLTDRFGYAAELRAIADEVRQRFFSGKDLDEASTDAFGDVIDWLRAEADEAEGKE